MCSISSPKKKTFVKDFNCQFSLKTIKIIILIISNRKLFNNDEIWTTSLTHSHLHILSFSRLLYFFCCLYRRKNIWIKKISSIFISFGCIMKQKRKWIKIIHNAEVKETKIYSKQAAAAKRNSLQTAKIAFLLPLAIHLILK